MPQDKPKIKLSELTDMYDIEEDEKEEEVTSSVVGKQHYTKQENEDIKEADEIMIEEFEND